MKDSQLLANQSQKRNRVKNNGMSTLMVKSITTTINKIFEKRIKYDQINLNQPENNK